MKRILLAAAIISNIATYAQPVTEGEKTTILHMREEEKMARDIYLTLNEKWNQQVFSNISGSETYHMSQIKVLIDKFKLEDPVAKNDDKRGAFANKDLKKMYDEFTTSGKTSLEAAFRAGAKVEEADIKDLKDAIANTVNADIKSTYKYLLQASENHLRAFVRNLKRLGIDYNPAILSEQYFKTIIDGDNKKGAGNGKGNKCRNNCCNDE